MATPETSPLEAGAHAVRPPQCRGRMSATVLENVGSRMFLWMPSFGLLLGAAAGVWLLVRHGRWGAGRGGERPWAALRQRCVHEHCAPSSARPREGPWMVVRLSLIVGCLA